MALLESHFQNYQTRTFRIALPVSRYQNHQNRSFRIALLVSRFQNHQYHASRISLGWRLAGRITLLGITSITLSESLESRFLNHWNRAFGITRITLSESRLFGPESGSAEGQYSLAPQESQQLHHDERTTWMMGDRYVCFATARIFL